MKGNVHEISDEIYDESNEAQTSKLRVRVILYSFMDLVRAPTGSQIPITVEEKEKVLLDEYLDQFRN